MKVIVRLLDRDKQLLGWAEVRGEMRGDSCLWMVGDRLEVVVEHDGVLVYINTHWVDMNTNLTAKAPTVDPHAVGVEVKVGQVWAITITEPLIRLGRSEESLPAVTERRSVEIQTPSGSLGLMGTVH